MALWPPASPSPSPPHTFLYTLLGCGPSLVSCSGPVLSSSTLDILCHLWSYNPQSSLLFIPEASKMAFSTLMGVVYRYRVRASESGRPAQILVLPILYDLGNDFTNVVSQFPSQDNGDDNTYFIQLCTV